MSNIKFRTFVPAVLSCLLLTMAGGSAEAYMSYAGYHHTLSMREARSVALQVHPGRVVSEMVGHARDGDKAYRFHIRNRGGQYSVGVNAVNGRVIENVKEGRRLHRSSGMERLFAPVHWGP